MAEPNYHDLFFREVMAQPEVISDLLTNYLPADVAPLIDTASAELIPGTFVDEKLREHRSDLIFQVKMTSGEAAYVYIILEHKSSVYPLVSWQVLKYAVPTWEAEVRSGAMTLTPILPIVFYHGKEKWKVAREFSALFDWSGRETLRGFTPEFRYLLLDLSKIPDDRIKGGWHLRAALIAFKYIYDQQTEKLTQNLIGVFKTSSGKISLRILEPLMNYIAGAGRGPKTDIEQIVEAAAPQHKEEIMTTFAQNWIQQGRQEGRQEGRVETLQQTLFRPMERRFGALDEMTRKRILNLKVESLASLSETWPDFTSLDDLTDWLNRNETAQ